MTAEELLADLRNAEWTTWPHAYGPARDTPTHLAALLGGDTTARESAAFHFQSAIVHQSTVWPASADAFDHLIQVLRTEPQPDKVLAGCLSALAEAAENVPAAGTPVPTLSSAAREWLATFATATEETQENLWEDALTTPTGDELWEWQLARLASLRPAVTALVTELSATALGDEAAAALEYVRAGWLEQ